MAHNPPWLRGPVRGVLPALQPVAHSLIDCREDVESRLVGVDVERIWTKPGNAASVGFHVRHAIGSLDRLFTYARGEQLSPTQQRALAAEGKSEERVAIQESLVADFDAAIQRALDQLRATDPATLLQKREVGRARLPSTVLGLLFHAAEHTQRHVGQLVTTSKVV